MFVTFLLVSILIFVIFVGANQVVDIERQINKYNTAISEEVGDLNKYDPYHSSRVQDTNDEFQKLAIYNQKNPINVPDNYNSDIHDEQRNGYEGSRVPPVGGKSQKTIYGDAYPQFRFPIVHKNWVPFFKNAEDPYIYSQRNKAFKSKKAPEPKWGGQ